MNYYNEFDPKAAQWLRNLIKAGLIPDGVVDERSIIQVQAADLVGYRQCHFFAGIGGWSLALQLAGWPADRRVWTGSCPCQPYSAAGKQKGDADERNLWPAWYQLLREFNARYPEQKPDTIFGEQVDKAIRHGWLDGICRDLEAEGYACGHAVLGAHSVGAKRWIEIVDEYTGDVAWRGWVKTSPPHIRQRLYWVAHSGVPASQRDSRGISAKEEECGGERQPDGYHAVGSANGSEADWVAKSDSTGRVTRGAATSTTRHRGAAVADGGWDSRLGDSEQQGLEGHGRDVGAGNEPGRIAADTERSVATAGSADRMGDTKCHESTEPSGEGARSHEEEAAGTSGQSEGRSDADSRLGDTEHDGSHGTQIDRGSGEAGNHGEEGQDIPCEPAGTGASRVSGGVCQDFWSDYYLVPCRDGKYRRVESGLRCLVNGVSFELADGSTSQESSRTVILKGLGNAIVPQVAAEFIISYMEVTDAAE